ncbi:complement C1q-like protein 2 [Ruditapes philippinarum]|uniref:complement C1q-like protein 2 n=1 Tax=Ruditapes philippinarum TaxID=129788 RepID=UPI00295B116D|nr:complement C1q-like protein 2 [Ruditapes philippinarum]
MFGYFSLSAVVFSIVLCYSQAIEDDPTFSKFKYDKQMLETMVRMEAKMNQWDKERKTFEENVLAVLEHRREEMQEKYLKQDEKLENIEGSFISTPKIAFNAYTKSRGSYGNSQPLVFPYVLLNMGEGYDKTTGVFTAPVTGLYFFSAHICNVNGQFMVISIIHEGIAIATTTEHESNLDSCSSVSAPVMVKKGGKVSVKSSYDKSKLMADDNYRWPSFAGVLLHV